MSSASAKTPVSGGEIIDYNLGSNGPADESLAKAIDATPDGHVNNPGGYPGQPGVPAETANPGGRQTDIIPPNKDLGSPYDA